ncbi:MAG: hypothetical protein OEV68_06390 [candidate division Zixibacteria bacterium]|nr:hypothetical protein [candidate division Zixibacteria bacterium]MDH4033913.1 hypothetical protein [candidate division Zixibacteria bacterium]
MTITILGLFATYMITGCGVPAKQFNLLKPEDTQQIKKLAIVTSMKDEELQVIDHSGMIKSLKEGRYANTGILGTLIIGGVIDANLRSSLGGDPDMLRMAVSDLPIKKLFDEDFTKTFVMGFETVSPMDVDNLGVDKYPRKKVGRKTKINDYTVLNDKLGADWVLELNFLYGLAAYGGGVSPSAVITADVSVIDIQGNKLLMRRAISSDDFYRKGYTVGEFRSRGGDLFKKEIVEAIQGLAHLVAKEFGEELSLKQKSRWNTE